MREMMVALQAKADICGALILSFELSDLQYDSSIAAGSEFIEYLCTFVDTESCAITVLITPASPSTSRRSPSNSRWWHRDHDERSWPGWESVESSLASVTESELASNLLCIITGESKVQPQFSLE